MELLSLPGCGREINQNVIMGTKYRKPRIEMIFLFLKWYSELTNCEELSYPWPPERVVRRC